MGFRFTVSSSCLLLLSLCCLLHFSAVAHERKQLPPSAMVVGTVVCDTCFHRDYSKRSHFISGASVAVECGDGTGTKRGFRKEAKTNRSGIFRIRLSPEFGGPDEAIKRCSVKLIKSGAPYCAVAVSAASSKLRFKSRRNGVHVFSAGLFTFKPLKQPKLCYKKPEFGTKQYNPGSFFFPPIPFVPEPPNIGGIPLPPNPLQPPPSLLPPLPLPQLPPPFTSLPPIPVLTPPPPPPAFHFPPFLFPPNPLFPGIPPAAASKRTFP